MTKPPGCILIVCRSPHIVPLAKYTMARMGVSNVRGTSAAGEGLYRVIRELKPVVIFMEADFYRTATPFMVGQILKRKPYLKIAVFSLGSYPLDREMWFVFHKVLGYINLQDGMAEFYRGLKQLVRGRAYVSRRVRKAIEGLKSYPAFRLDESEREDEVMRLLADGYTTKEIEEALRISDRTVERHKTNMFNRYHVRNTVELIKDGVLLGRIRYEISN
jgi:DNA-binding NarL/FixJ family response regulator